MSIIITDLKMPTERESFNITIKYNGTVLDTETGIQIAEAYELPPHGRLIDADAMLMRINHEGMEAYMDGVCYGVHPSQEYLDLLGEIIDDAPTIIPADPAEEGET